VKSYWRRTAGRIVIPLVILAMTLVMLAGCDPLPVYQEPVAGTVCRWDFPSSADGLGLPCSVYLPAGYNPTVAYPVWVELHALYAIPLIDNDPNNPFSNELKRLADERGWILLAPWGRNLHSLFVDGMVKDQAPYYEPSIYDDFSGGSGSWQAVNGTWAATDGRYVQSDRMPNWKESLCLGSEGEDYAVRVKVRDLTPQGTTSAFGVNIHRADNGDCYHVDLYRGLDNKKYVRFYKLVNGEWQGIATMPFDWQPLTPLDNWITLKVSCYEDYLEVYVNEKIVNMQPGYDATPYGYGWDVPGTPLAPGEVSLCSFGGVHEFDDVRIQNEYEYGERDVLDCVLGAMEKYRIDPGRIYVAGHSQGGSGTFSLGLHHPDLCAALRPADGFTDIYYDYNWLKTNYPPNPGAPYANINDGRLTEYMRVLAGGEASSSYPERMSVLNGNSARYILENAVNNYFRIVHGTPDSNVPNSLDPVQISWWAPWWFMWGQTPAPAPYTPATSTYANGKAVADLLQSWSSPGRYYCDYVTSATIGHGFLEPYNATANFFQDKTLNLRPSEVAFKTYDDVNNGAWWLRLEIPNPGHNEPGMARVSVNAAANSAAVHARNLSRLTLDLAWMGLSNAAGKTMTFTLDDDTSPNVFPITDNTGDVTLELAGAWTATSGYVVRLDGSTLASGSDYTVNGTSLVLPDLAVQGGHTLTVTSPSSLPSNLAPNPGAETDAGGGYPASWTGEVQGGGNAYMLWDDLEVHGGARSLRVKDASFSSADSKAVWRSNTFSVSSGRQYLLGAFARARMLKGANPVIGITWYNYWKQPISSTWVESPATEDFSLNSAWSPMRLKASAPTGSYYASIQVGIEGEYAGQAAGSVWFDDISFTTQ
jgi:pimeloyl-ACP methyl ester carboxylesterase